ncbi:hypothetical protein MHYP_G00068910 [Metynnis hypsauchen]
MPFSQVQCTVCISSRKQSTCWANHHSSSLHALAQHSSSAEVALRVAKSFPVIPNYVPLDIEHSQLAVVAGAAQGLERSRLAEGGQLWGRRGLAVPGLRGGEWRCGEAHRAVTELSWVALEALALEGTSLLLPHRCHLDPLTPCRSWHRAKP